MRFSSLALLVLALQYSPAPAQALPLSDSLVVGAWEFNTQEWSADTSSESEIRYAGFFTEQHTFESMLWTRYEDYMDVGTMKIGTLYTGIRMTGTWFIRDTLVGMVYSSCVGFTDPGRRECETMADGLGDTSYLTLEEKDLPTLGPSRLMRATEEWRIYLWRYQGPVRDMSEPDFWEGAPSLSLRRDARARASSLYPGAVTGTPAFDVLGRLPSGETPVRLYPSNPVQSRTAR